MSRFSALETLLIAQAFIGLFDVIVTDGKIFESMSFEDRRDFFETEDGSVPEHQVVKLDNTLHKISAHPVLRIPFVNDGKTTVVLNIVNDHDLIGPRTTGIWFAGHDLKAYHNVSYIPVPGVFENIGDYRLYQNSSEGAAIAIFTYPEIQEGVVGYNYIVKSLPSEAPERSKKRSLKNVAQTKLSNLTDNQNDDFLPRLVIFKPPNMTNTMMRLRNHIIFANRPDITGRRRRDLKSNVTPDVVYPKLLVTTDYLSLRMHNSAERLVKDLIVFFNIADMVYREINEPQIRLTIAGIILPLDYRAIPYITHDRTYTFIEGEGSLNMMSKYFLDETVRFPFTNYDVIIAMVRAKIWIVNDEEGFEVVGVVAKVGAACDRKSSAAMVRYYHNYASVMTFVHELAHLFKVRHDLSETPINTNNHTCIMSESENYSDKLCWSHDSRRQLREFFSSVGSKCMYERPNKIPDSVKYMKGAWLSLYGQCQNRLNDTKGYGWKADSCQDHQCFNYKNHSEIIETMEGSILSNEARCINGVWA